MWDVVEEVNNYTTSLNVNDERTYHSLYSVCQSDIMTNILTDLHNPKFSNSIKYLDLLLHELKFKVGITGEAIN